MKTNEGQFLCANCENSETKLLYLCHHTIYFGTRKRDLEGAVNLKIFILISLILMKCFILCNYYYLLNYYCYYYYCSIESYNTVCYVPFNNFTAWWIPHKNL